MATTNPFDPTALANGTSTLTMRTSALNQSEDLQQAGTVFNDAVRLSEGGLWNLPASATDVGNQQPYEQLYQADIQAVLNDVGSMLANPNNMTINGVAYTPSAADTQVLNQVQGQLQTLLNEAPASVGGTAAAAQAQDLIHTTQNEIINEIQGDSALAAALNHPFMSGTGANDTGFQALPVGSDSASALAAATAQGATLEQIGLVFNAANDLAAGGLNTTNLSEFNTDYQAAATGVQNILNNPTELAQIESGETAAQAALTTLHLDTVLNQLDLQINKFDSEYAVDPVMAARSTNDNTLDIIDIVQNDTNLNMAAGGNGTPATTGGFGEFPAYLNGAGGVNAHGGTIQQYQDNQAQTDFWSQFIAEANQIQTQLNGVANSTTPVPASDLNALITEIQNYQQFGASFDDAQGGVFGARFDNELLSGTLLADTNNSVAGLTAILHNGGTVTTAAAAQIEAAGSGFVADANDVSGNNLPLGGTNYNGASTTVAGATTPTGLPSATATVPVSGEVDGNDHPTSGVNLAANNEEFGVTFPNPNGTTSAAGAGGATTPTAGAGSAGGTPTTGAGGAGGTPTTGAGGEGGGTPTAGTGGEGGGSQTAGAGGEGSTHGGTGEGAMTPTIASDIAALIQALEGGNGSAVSTAMAALVTAVNGGTGGAAGSASAAGGGDGAAGGAGNSFGDGGAAGAGHHHFEHMWHF
jgi:trimeric autotransporter adhesin